MPITDKMGKIGSLSVKCVLLTDKSSKKGPLSVNLDEILAELVEKHCIKKMPDIVQSHIDRLRSIFHLIQARNGTFFPDS